MNIKILSLDHVGFNVADPEKSLQFYAGVLGLRSERVEAFRAGAVPFPSVRIDSDTIFDFFSPRYVGTALDQKVNHIALTLANSPACVQAFLGERGIPIVAEMTGNFGARGNNAHAVHILDPDGNVLELNSYS